MGLLYSAPMRAAVPEALLLMAGGGVYPVLLAEAARKHGVRRIVCIAFRGEASRALSRWSDEIHWIPVGQVSRWLEILRQAGIRHVVMAGLLRPTLLFRVRPDALARSILSRLPRWNAHTIFGAAVEEVRRLGLEVLPASMFMSEHMPPSGVLTRRPPTAEEQADIELGVRVAQMTSDLDIGQTVVIKQRTILAVEAFEGTDGTIRRAARLGGPGIVVVKLAKRGHDLRFDIPVVGAHTLRLLRRVRAAALAMRAGHAILLERPRLIEMADRQNLTWVILPPLEDPVPSGGTGMISNPVVLSSRSGSPEGPTLS